MNLGTKFPKTKNN